MRRYPGLVLACAIVATACGGADVNLLPTSTTVPITTTTTSTTSPSTTTTTTLGLRMALQPECTADSRVCPAVEFAFEDPYLIIEFPGLSEMPDLLMITFTATYPDAPVVECRRFGSVANCGRRLPDQSLDNPKDIEVTVDNSLKMRVPAELLMVDLFDHFPFHATEVHASTAASGDFTGRFTEEQKAEMDEWINSIMMGFPEE